MNIYKRSGFTLVEIMIVIAIIGLLAAIAIPTWVRAKKEHEIRERQKIKPTELSAATVGGMSFVRAPHTLSLMDDNDLALMFETVSKFEEGNRGLFVTDRQIVHHGGVIIGVLISHTNVSAQVLPEQK